MAKLIVNRNFNKRYISKYIKEILKPIDMNVDDTQVHKVFFPTAADRNADGSISDTYEPALFYLMTESAITMLIEYNKYLIEQGDHTTATYLNTREQLETMDAFTDIKKTGFTSIPMKLDAWNLEYQWKYNNSQDYYTFSKIRPSKLALSFNEDLPNGESYKGIPNEERNNANHEPLYFVFPQYLPTSDEPVKMNSFTTVQNKQINADGTYDIVRQYGYYAFELGLEGSGKDIELDHLDKIDYLDAIEIKMRARREYS